jgi:hypothetical protein
VLKKHVPTPNKKSSFVAVLANEYAVTMKGDKNNVIGKMELDSY